MNMLKKGPDIKLPELKVPDALYDLYYDLRERHLLPLVAVLVVAIVAVPIALSQSSESKSPSAAVALAVSSAMTKPPRRARGRQSRPGPAPLPPPARLPARQGIPSYSSTPTPNRRKAPPRQAAEAAKRVANRGLPAPLHRPKPPPPPTPAPGRRAAEPRHVTRHLTYYSYAIDVRVVSGGGSQGGSAQSESTQSGMASTSKSKPHDAQVRHNLPELTMLPSRKTPAAIFMGVSKDGKKALLLLSSSVDSVFGEGLCVLGGADLPAAGAGTRPARDLRLRPPQPHLQDRTAEDPPRRLEQAAQRDLEARSLKRAPPPRGRRCEAPAQPR